MSLVVNHNLMAANVARNLNAHYANLANSTQRLSTGLRINSAADDAAGLAIRELQRADIAALHQGARNANDAISLIQVADGALQIIDEKLIRMKELAEQAATGTYDSTQRLMIESEYQAMASEITRIANATDFNGMKLLDGTLASDEHNGSKLDSEGKMKIHFGTGNDSAEDYYYIQIEEASSQAFGVGDASTWEDASGRIVKSFEASLSKQIKAWKEDGTYTAEELDGIMTAAESWPENLKEQLEKYTTFTNATELEALYNQFKSDEEVSALSDLFKESIDDFDSVTYREQNKMQYALGHAAMRRVELFEFDNYSPASSVYKAVSEVTKQLTGDGLITGEPSITGDVDAWKAASTDANTAVTAANTMQGKVNTAKDYAQFVADAIAVANNTTVTNAISADLKSSSPGLSVSYSPDGGTTEYTISYTTVGGIQSITQSISGTDKYTITCNGTEKSGSFSSASISQVADPTPTHTYGVNTYGSTYELTEGGDAFLANSDGKLESSKDSSGNTYLINNDSSNNAYIASMTDTNNNTLVFKKLDSTTAVDPTKDVQSMTDKYGNTYTFSSGNFVGMKDVHGNTLELDGSVAINGTPTASNVTSITDSSGNYYVLSSGEISSVQYGSTNYLVNTTDKTITDTTTGNVYTFNDSGLLASAADSLGNDITSQQLAKEGLLESIFADAEAEAQKRNYAGFTVATQEDAQNALEAISDAIEAKDKIRARLGALQNRLENTISNLNIQAENLQAAESRISDVDVSTEMTEFVRQQILTQSAVAMLSQANSLPQMAMQLIGG